jgi:hypothetical protein
LDFLHAVITVTVYSTISYDEHKGATATPNQTIHPILQTFATAQVLSYGLSSRTSQMGFAVAVLGCMIVGLHLVVGLCAPFSRFQPPDVLDTFTTALRHPPEELASLSGKDLESARFMANDEKDDTEFTFGKKTL